MSNAVTVDTVWPGKPHPRGATWDGHGVNFALFSRHAEAVELCLFDARGRESQRIQIRERTDHVWHCYLPQLRPGQAYGYRVHGPYKPEEGHRFNAHKLLLDPYAKDYTGRLRWNDALYGYTVGHRRGDLSFDRRDSAAYMPKCRVLEGAFTWGDDRRPAVDWQDMVVYEMHVKGFTMLHPKVPDILRGTYAGLSTAPAIDHLRRLGITTVELLPVHSFITDRHLAEREMQNYWGYNTLGFFVPEPRYSYSQKVKEFKTMVRSLHAAGIEVILDVVYNHTCEGNQLGPTLSMRGVDNASYYVLADDRRYYNDVTGCGNTLNTQHPRVLQMVMDSLRYWVQEMHIDGFRFDLASALARKDGRVEPFGGFLDAVCQDPVLTSVKLIAEPWDLGQDGYQVGNFPAGWAEWNDRYRDGVRSYWKGDSGQLGEFARRFTGSSDLYGRSGKRPNASINFVSAHDGFTLHDLVSYNGKHNEANGEDNRDGTDNNRSWNCGVEGPTDDAAINALRAQQKRNFLATLMLSQGVPMLLSGDELGHTQGGNNNAYAQDNAISWLDWNLGPEQQAQIDFVASLIALRREHPTFHRRDFFPGNSDERGRDVLWLRPDGQEMTEAQWAEDFARCLGMFISGHGLSDTDARGVRRQDDDFLLLFNAHHEEVAFAIPDLGAGPWTVRVNTANATAPVAQAAAPLATGQAEATPDAAPVAPGASYQLPPRSLVVLTRPAAPRAA